MMKTIEITGENYSGHWDRVRAASRAVILRDGKLLLSYETETDQWMLPGGGVEDGESDTACCTREVAEETGVLVSPAACFLEIDELYETCKWVNRYFICTAVGTAPRKPTAQEQRVGLVPRWLPVEEAKKIFGGYAAYDGVDEMRRGMYLREYTALCVWEQNLL